MSLWCTECAGRVRNRKGCPKHPLATIEQVPGLDGFMWFGESNERAFSRGRRKEDQLTQDATGNEPTLSPHDLAHIDDILIDRSGRHFDWFSCHLLRLIAKADAKNRERLSRVYPNHVSAYEAWYAGKES